MNISIFKQKGIIGDNPLKNFIRSALSVILLFSLSSAQNFPYKFSPTKDPSFAYGYYIPENLEDSYKELKRAMSPEYQEYFKNLELEKVLDDEQLSLGLWMREYWGLHSGSRLRLFFNQKGIKMPDNMSGAILEGFWNHLNGRYNDFEKWVIKDIEYHQNLERWMKKKKIAAEKTVNEPAPEPEKTAEKGLLNLGVEGQSNPPQPQPAADTTKATKEKINRTNPREYDPLKFSEGELTTPDGSDSTSKSKEELDPLKYKEP
jgi:hypothetical protein